MGFLTRARVELQKRKMECPTASYVWNLDITKAKKPTEAFSSSTGKYYKSSIVSMVGFRWYLQFALKSDENCSQLVLTCCGLPPDVKSCTISHENLLNETGTRRSANNLEFSEGKGHYMNHKLWSVGVLETKSVEHMTKFSITIEVTLTGVIDKNNKDITNRYMGAQIIPASSAHHLEARVRAIERVLHKANMMSLPVAEHKEDPDKEAFISWVNDTLKLPEYLDMFIDNGFDTLKALTILTKKELEMIGIGKLGHQMLILSQARSLR